MLDHTKPYVEKIHSIDAELARHVHKLDVKKPQKLCGTGFSVFCAHACQAQLTTLWNKDGVHFFTLNFECHNKYKKLLFNFENDDIAWCNKNNSE